MDLNSRRKKLEMIHESIDKLCREEKEERINIMPETKSVVKPGKETSEFWGKIVVQLILVAVAAGWIKPDVVEAAQPYVELVALISASVLEGVYSISRAIAKRGT